MKKGMEKNVQGHELKLSSSKSMKRWEQVLGGVELKGFHFIPLFTLETSSKHDSQSTRKNVYYRKNPFWHCLVFFLMYRKKKVLNIWKESKYLSFFYPLFFIVYPTFGLFNVHSLFGEERVRIVKMRSSQGRDFSHFFSLNHFSSATRRAIIKNWMKNDYKNDIFFLYMNSTSENSQKKNSSPHSFSEPVNLHKKDSLQIYYFLVFFPLSMCPKKSFLLRFPSFLSFPVR